MLCSLGTVECYIRRLSKCTLEDALGSTPVFKPQDVGNLQNIMSVCPNDAASYGGDRAVFVKSRPWQMHNDSQPVYNGTTEIKISASKHQRLGGSYYYFHAPGRRNFFEQREHDERAAAAHIPVDVESLNAGSQRTFSKAELTTLVGMFQLWVDRELMTIYGVDKSIITGVATAFVMRPNDRLWGKYEQFLVESGMGAVHAEQDSVGLHVRRGDKLSPENPIEARFMDTAFFSSSCYTEVLARFQIALPTLNHIFLMTDDKTVSSDLAHSELLKDLGMEIHIVPTEHFHNFGNHTAARILSAKLGIIDDTAAVGNLKRRLNETDSQDYSNKVKFSASSTVDEGMSLLASVMIMVLNSKVFIGAANGHVDILIESWKTGLLALGLPYGTFSSPVLLDMNFLVGAGLESGRGKLLSLLPEWLVGYNRHQLEIPKQCEHDGYKSTASLLKDLDS